MTNINNARSQLGGEVSSMGWAGLDYLWNATSTHTFNLPPPLPPCAWHLPLICLTNLQHSLGNTSKVLNVMSHLVDYLTISWNICVGENTLSSKLVTIQTILERYNLYQILCLTFMASCRGKVLLP